MTNDERHALIRAIVEEVLGRLSATSSEAKPQGRIVVALSRTVSRTCVDDAARLAERGFAVVALATSAGFPFDAMDRALSALPAYRFASLPADAQAVVAPELGLTDAARLASGVLDDAVPDALWRGLVSRIPVFASPGDGFAADLPKPLARIAATQRLAIERLGVRWTERNVLWNAVNDALHQTKRRDTQGQPTRRPLITEATIASLPPNVREYAIASNAIVTPLARDAARRRAILLVRRSTP